MRWYEIDLDGWGPANPTNDPVLVQEGEIDPGGDIHAFFPSIAVQFDGAVAITYCKSSDEDVVTMHGKARDATDTAGTFTFSEDFAESGDPWEYNQAWGDYSGTEPDPDETCKFWSAHQFAVDEDTWGVWIGPQYVTCILGPGGGDGGTAACPSDCNLDGHTDVLDFVCFESKFSARRPYGDFDADGDFDAFDYISFQTAFVEGCR